MERILEHAVRPMQFTLLIYLQVYAIFLSVNAVARSMFLAYTCLRFALEYLKGILFKQAIVSIMQSIEEKTVVVF